MWNIFTDVVLRGCYSTITEYGMLLFMAGKRLNSTTFVWRVVSADTSDDDIVSAMNYTNWWQGEPNNANSNVCVELMSAQSYKWADTPCNFQQCSICEVDL